MFNKKLLILLSVFFLSRIVAGQTPCDILGQNPGTAFPVCGTDTFSILSVKTCGNRPLINPASCTNVQFTDKNPYWYKFTCFTAGTLGFFITPNTITDDYDWQIFDVTNRNPNDIYTDGTMFVACNWSGEGGITGTNSTAANLTECDGFGVPKFTKMPTLIEGHEYVLLVSHFTNSQSGYSLSFGGG